MQIEMIRDDVLFFSGNSSYGNSEKNPLVLQKLSLLGIINDAKMKTGTVANLFTGKNKNISGHGAL